MATKKVGGIEFSEAGYEKFKALSKEEQIERVATSYSPKDVKRAEKDLAHIPYGNSKGTGKQAKGNSATGGNGNGKDNTTQPATT